MQGRGRMLAAPLPQAYSAFVASQSALQSDGKAACCILADKAAQYDS